MLIFSPLFSIRNDVHRQHLLAKSFAVHVALDELYEYINEFIDSFAEMYQGKYGVHEIEPSPTPFEFDSATMFVQKLYSWAEHTKHDIHDSFLQNEWDNFIATVARTKYKLENLK